MLIQIVAGALAFALAQFIWYSPLFFGPLWRQSHGLTPVAAYEAAVSPGWGVRWIMGSVVPACLTSMALVALALVLDRAGWGPRVSIVGMLAFPSLVVLPKYLRSLFVLRLLDTTVIIQDGALLVGTWAAVGALTLSR
jgi:hypothetical protein